MLFAPKEKKTVAKTSTLEAIEAWVRKIAKLSYQFVDQAEDKRSASIRAEIVKLQQAGKIDEKEAGRRMELLNSRQWDPTLDETTSSSSKKELRLAMRLPESIIREVRQDFANAFPRYADVFANTNFDYWLGHNPLTTADLASFYDLLTEKGTLMGEAYPFYEILTQELSEKVASASGGLRAVFLGTLSKGLGVFGYKADTPVFRRWVEVKNKLKTQYGRDTFNELVEDMYFGDKDGYQKFIEACSDAGIDFKTIVAQAQQESLFINKVYESIIRNPNVLKSHMLVGSLNLPGKIYDMSGPILPGLFGSVIGMAALLNLPGWGALLPTIGLIPVGSVGMVYHEITHIFGSNFRRAAKKNVV